MRIPRLVQVLSVAVVAAVALPHAHAQAAEARASSASRVGMKIDDFTLKSHFGKEYALHDFADKDVVVVVFLGTECPLAKLYAPRLAELAKKFDGKRVAFVGIDSNRQDSIQEIAAYAQRQQDRVSDSARIPATRWPTSSPRSARPRCSCSIKTAWSATAAASTTSTASTTAVGFQRPEPTRNDLVEAIDELLAGKPVSVADDRGGRLPYRPRPRGERQVRGDLQQADRPHLSGALRRVPSRGPDRAVRDDQLRRSGRLGRDDPRSGRPGTHAALARRSGARRFRQRPAL